MRLLMLKTASLDVDMKTGPDVHDLTPGLLRLFKELQPWEGIVSICAVGSTASMTTIEFEAGALEDLKRAINRLAPPEQDYRHNLAWHDGNGHSHVQAAFLGPSLTVPIRKGRPVLGTWQQVILINHDNRPRKRRVEITFIYSPPPDE